MGRAPTRESSFVGAALAVGEAADAGVPPQVGWVPAGGAALLVREPCGWVGGLWLGALEMPGAPQVGAGPASGGGETAGGRGHNVCWVRHGGAESNAGSISREGKGDREWARTPGRVKTPHLLGAPMAGRDGIGARRPYLDAEARGRPSCSCCHRRRARPLAQLLVAHRIPLGAALGALGRGFLDPRPQVFSAA